MHDSAQQWGGSDSHLSIDLGPGSLEVTHLDSVRGRVSLARSRELVVARLLARGISATTLRILLPDRRAIIDRLAA